jgi:transposase InsO family protein
MRRLGLEGVVRGKAVRTTVQDKAASCPIDLVNRQFHTPAPAKLWVSDFTYVSTWGGFIYVAFVIDVYARRIVGWRVSRNSTEAFVLDALEQALHDRRPTESLVHHWDRGSQCVSIRSPSGWPRLASNHLPAALGLSRQRARRKRHWAVKD